MKYLFILLLLPLSVVAQQDTFTTTTTDNAVATFKNILRKTSTQYLSDTTQPIRYPIVITANDDASSKINNQLKLCVFASVFKDVQNQQAVDLLDSFITIGLNKFSYKPTFNKKGILSLTVTYESCGTNCVDTTIILNFDIITGRSLAIKDVISKDNFDLFMKGVQVDKATALNKYKTDLKNQLDDKDISKTDYTAATDDVDNNCMTSVQVKNFIITETGIEIIDNCELPHTLQEIQPSYHLIYPYTTIKSLLNKDFADKAL